MPSVEVPSCNALYSSAIILSDTSSGTSAKLFTIALPNGNQTRRQSELAYRFHIQRGFFFSRCRWRLNYYQHG